MPSLAIDSLAHCNVKITRDAIDSKVSAQIAPLAPRHFLGFGLTASLSYALLGEGLDGIFVPAFLFVRGQYLVARVAALVLLLV